VKNTKTYNVVGNSYYVITEERKVLRKDGGELDLPMSKDSVTIQLYGYTKTVELEWLYWLSYFKLDLQKEFQEYVFEYTFKDHSMLGHMKIDPKIVVFKKPLYFGDDNRFRLIARFPNYGIDYSGVCINVKTGSLNTPYTYVGGYTSSAITDQSNLYSSTKRATHRLVATTWIDNVDYKTFPLVNHIDGNKTNCHYTNLEWVSYSGNMKHAIKTGLRDDNITIYSRNIIDGTTAKHDSLTQAAEHIGRSRINTKTNPIKRGYLWTGTNGSYELRTDKDTWDWYFTDKDVKPINSVATIVNITMPGGIKKTYYNLTDVRKELLNKDGVISLDRIKKRLVKLYPGILIDITYSKKIDGYDARDIKTLKTYYGRTAKELSEQIGLGKSTVIKYGNISDSSIINGYQVRKHSNDPWFPISGIKEPINIEINIEVLDIVERTRTTYNSLRVAAAALEIDRKTIKSLARSGSLLRNKYKINLV